MRYSLTRHAKTVVLFFFLMVIPLSCFGSQFIDTPVQNASVNDISIGYRVLGQGEPLLLITGYGATMDVWDHTLVDRLAQSFQVITFDNRGMGYSTANETPFSFALFVSDTLALLDHLNISKVHVLGWSMGSFIAQELALTAPGRTDDLILYASAPDSTKVIQVLDKLGTLKADELMGMMFPKHWQDRHPDIFTRLPAPPSAPEPAIVARQRDVIEQWTPSARRLGLLSNNVLLLVGEDDFITPSEHSRTMANIIPKARVVTFQHGGHWLMYQAPEQMAHTITSFIQAEK